MSTRALRLRHQQDTLPLLKLPKYPSTRLVSARGQEIISQMLRRDMDTGRGLSVWQPVSSATPKSGRKLSTLVPLRIRTSDSFRPPVRPRAMGLSPRTSLSYRTVEGIPPRDSATPESSRTLYEILFSCDSASSPIHHRAASLSHSRRLPLVSPRHTTRPITEEVISRTPDEQKRFNHFRRIIYEDQYNRQMHRTAVDLMSKFKLENTPVSLAEFKNCVSLLPPDTTKITFNNCQLDDSAGVCLAGQLSRFRNLKKLDLSNNQLTEISVNDIIFHLNISRIGLSKIDLSGNPIETISKATCDLLTDMMKKRKRSLTLSLQETPLSARMSYSKKAEVGRYFDRFPGRIEI